MFELILAVTKKRNHKTHLMVRVVPSNVNDLIDIFVCKFKTNNYIECPNIPMTIFYFWQIATRATKKFQIAEISINHLATPKVVQKSKNWIQIYINHYCGCWRVKNMIIWNLWDLCLFSRLEICFSHLKLFEHFKHFKHFKLLTNSLNWIICEFLEIQ